MESHKRIRKNQPFVVTPERLSLLVNSLPRGETKPKITVSCVDGTTMYPGSLDELFSYPNPKTREITAIEVQGPHESSLWRTIDLSSESVFPVTYSVGGEDRSVVSVVDLMERHLEPMIGSSYSFLSMSDYVELAFVFLFGPSLFVLGIALFFSYAIVIQHKHLVMGTLRLHCFGWWVSFCWLSR